MEIIKIYVLNALMIGSLKATVVDVMIKIVIRANKTMVPCA